MRHIPDKFDVRLCRLPVAVLAPLIPRERTGDNCFRMDRLEADIRRNGIVEPLLVRNEKCGLIVEIGNQRLYLAEKVGIRTVNCIVNTVLPSLQPIPIGERLYTYEDVLSKLAHRPDYIDLVEWGVNFFNYDFTKEQIIPKKNATLFGSPKCREEIFEGHRRVVMLGDTWSHWRLSTRRLTLYVLSGKLWLLRQLDSGISNLRLVAGEFVILPKHTEYCTRTYHGASEFVLAREN